MEMHAHTIQAAPHARKKRKRVGRGNASQRGTYSGRGGKGQTARSGGAHGLQRRSWKALLQKIPKSRGFQSGKQKPETLTLEMLNRAFQHGEEVSLASLKKKRIIGKEIGAVKIVATGLLEHALTVRGCLLSKKAVELVKKAGGNVVF